MPSNSLPVKIAAVRGYGAKVTLCEPTTNGREDAAAAILARLPNARLIHPSDDPHVICGQGTVGERARSTVAKSQNILERNILFYLRNMSGSPLGDR